MASRPATIKERELRGAGFNIDLNDQTKITLNALNQNALFVKPPHSLQRL
jgi:hypothetical protein